MNNGTKKMLAAMRHALFDTGDWGSRYESANIMAAIRGPDNKDPNDEFKWSTTAIIRYRALGDAYPGATNMADSDAWVEKRWTLPQGHFRNHMEQAFEALGLKWNENNGEIKPCDVSVRSSRSSRKMKKRKSSSSPAPKKVRRSGTRR